MINFHQFDFTSCHAETMNADRENISSVISNLLSNAVKYWARKFVVQIACEIDENEIRVSVTDQGIGIQPADAEKLFDRYYRV